MDFPCRLAQLVSQFNQESFPSCRAVQRTKHNLVHCKSSWHIHIFCAPFDQIPAVVNNVIRSSPKSKAVCEITSLGYGIERMPSEKKALIKKRKATASMRKAQATLKPWKKCKKITVSCCPTYLGVKDGAGLGSSPREGWENCRPVQEMWLQRLITNTSKQKKISQNKLIWESKNWGFLTLTNLFVPEHLDSKFYPGEIFLQLLTDFFFLLALFSQIRDLIFNSILVHIGAYYRRTRFSSNFCCLKFQDEFFPPVLTPMGVTLVLLNTTLMVLVWPVTELYVCLIHF